MADKEDFDSSWNDATRRYTKARPPSLMVETSDSRVQVLPHSRTPSSRVCTRKLSYRISAVSSHFS